MPGRPQPPGACVLCLLTGLLLSMPLIVLCCFFPLCSPRFFSFFFYFYFIFFYFFSLPATVSGRSQNIRGPNEQPKRGQSVHRRGSCLMSYNVLGMWRARSRGPHQENNNNLRKEEEEDEFFRGSFFFLFKKYK